MNRLELFKTWAPPQSKWSRWAKPALFAEMNVLQPLPQDAPVPRIDVANDAGTAVIVDLPGAQSVQVGLALAQDGYRPVPLFNSAYQGWAVVSVEGIAQWLARGANMLSGLSLPPEAPPAFLLDSKRKGGEVLPMPGKFDNRWVVFPQDFPSYNYLMANGIRRVLLFHDRSNAQPDCDLAHVLLRWQEAGLELYESRLSIDAPPAPMRVKKPSNFGTLWYRVLAMAGLRRNSAGGFGDVVPEPSSSHG